MIEGRGQGRQPTMNSVRRAATCAVLALLLFGAFALRVMADEYYEASANEAVYVAWTQDGTGHLQGAVTVISLPSSGSTQIKTTNAAFTGTRSGSDISFTFGWTTAYGGTTWTGHIAWGKLTLVFPTNGVPGEITLIPGSFDQFRSAAAQLQGSAEVNQSHATLASAVTEAANNVDAGTTALASGLASLRAMFPKGPTDPSSATLSTKYAQQWSDMQAAFRKEQDDGNVEPMTCYQKSQVQYDASGVQYQLASFQYLDVLVGAARRSYDGALGQVQSGMDTIQTWAPLYDDRARAYASATGGAYNRNIAALLAPQVSGAQKSLDYFSDRWTSFATLIVGYDRKAKQETDDAMAYANSIACSG